MDIYIAEYLLRLGFSPNRMGYRFLTDILRKGLNNEKILPLKYVAYTKLSEKYKKSVAAVEKDIQNAIATAWLKGDVKVLYEEFGETIDMKKGKPTNKQFIITALYSIKNKLIYHKVLDT